MSEGQIELVGGPEDGRVMDLPEGAVQMRLYVPVPVQSTLRPDDRFSVAVYCYDGQPARSGRVRFSFVGVR